MTFLKIYIAAIIFFLAIDVLWLGVIAKNFYQKHIGTLLRPDVEWGAVIIFYLLFVAGLVIFVVMPALDKQSMLHAVAYGALFGLVTYATYDLTNLATLKNWSLTVTIVDLLWGAALSAMVASLTYIFASKWLI